MTDASVVSGCLFHNSFSTFLTVNDGSAALRPGTVTLMSKQHMSFQLVLCDKSFATLAANKIQICLVGLLVTCKLGFGAKHLVTPVTGIGFHVVLFDVGLKSRLFKVHLSADVAWSAKGGVCISKVNPHLKVVGCHLFTTYSAGNILSFWILG